MKEIIIFLSILGPDAFFIIAGILGITYEGSSNSLLYIGYNIILFTIVLCLCFYYILYKKFTFSKKELFIISLPCFIIFNTLIISFRDINFINNQRFILFILWILPIVLIALVVKKINLYSNLCKYFDIFVIITTFSLVNTVIVPFLHGVKFESIGGATYQNAAYYAAFSFGITLYLLLFNETIIRFKYFKLRIIKPVYFIFLLLQIISLFLAGGRGAIVLLIIYVLYFSYMVLKSKNIIVIKRFIIISISFIGLSLIIWPYIRSNELFIRGFNRVFEFLQPAGINWNGTSGRDVVYQDAIYLISKNPLIGYGFFRKNELFGFPHNIFLEIILNIGIIGLIFSIVIFIICFKNAMRMINHSKFLMSIVVLFLYPAVMLLFSGSYLINTLFWYCVVTMFIYDEKYIKI